jgi:hypothetical protein
MLAGRCIECHEPRAPSYDVVAITGIGGQGYFFHMSDDLVYGLIVMRMMY